MRRFILALLAVLFFLGIICGTIMVTIAPKALPGNKLYPLRLWSEQLRYVTNLLIWSLLQVRNLDPFYR